MTSLNKWRSSKGDLRSKDKWNKMKDKETYTISNRWTSSRLSNCSCKTNHRSSSCKIDNNTQILRRIHLRQLLWNRCLNSNLHHNLKVTEITRIRTTSLRRRKIKYQTMIKLLFLPELQALDASSHNSKARLLRRRSRRQTLPNQLKVSSHHSLTYVRVRFCR